MQRGRAWERHLSCACGACFFEDESYGLPLSNNSCSTGMRKRILVACNRSMLRAVWWEVEWTTETNLGIVAFPALGVLMHLVRISLSTTHSSENLSSCKPLGK